MTSKSRARLRLTTAMTAGIAALTMLIVLLSTGVLVYAARNIIYETRQEVLLADFRAQTDAIRDELLAQSHPAARSALSERVGGTTTIIDLRSNAAVGELDPGEIPASLQLADGASSGALTYQRATFDGHEAFFVAVAWTPDHGDDDAIPSAVIAAYSMKEQQQQVLQLLTAGSVIGASAVLLTGLMGFILAKSITRPLHRLTRLAEQVGQEPSSPAPVSVFSDIDRIAVALHTSGKQLVETMSELSRSENHARRLVSDVAHELRTPLTSMMAVAEILDDRDASAEEKSLAVQVINSGTQRLAVLIEQLLELSRMDAGMAPVALSRFVIGDLLHEVAELSSPFTQTTLRYPEDLAVTTDPERLTAILINLLSNAAHHGAPPVTMVASVDGSRLVIRVSDEGPGIAAEDRARVFDRFVTLDAARQRPGGNGLGLAIARDNARLLGGDLVLEPSTIGAVFTVSIPLHDDHGGVTLL